MRRPIPPVPLLATTMVAATLLALAACASSSGGETDARDTTLRYMCNDGTAFIARFGANSVSLDFGGGAGSTLVQQPSSGPFHYSSSEYDMRGDTNQVAFSKAGGAPTTCLRGNPRDLMPR